MEATHACENMNCEHIGWTVQQSPLNSKIWQIESSTRSFSVAANRPICPICGEGLLKLIPLEILQEPSPMPAKEKLVAATL